MPAGHHRLLAACQVSAEDIRRAHAVHPITAYQLEWSLWSRDAEVCCVLVSNGCQAWCCAGPSCGWNVVPRLCVRAPFGTKRMCS